VERDERQIEYPFAEVEVAHVRLHHRCLELACAQPLLQARQHPRGGVHTGKVHPGFQQRYGNPPGPAHQLQDPSLARLGGFLEVEADVEVGADVEIVDIRHAIVVDRIGAGDRFAWVLACWTRGLTPLGCGTVARHRVTGPTYFRELLSLLKKSLSTRLGAQEGQKTRRKHYENVAFGP
jgi:hypothetical protein